MRLSLASYVFVLTYLTVPTFATDWNVATSDQLTAALAAAAPGDRIILQAGTTFTGTFTLPKKTGTGWITLQSSAVASLPPGVRVSPASAAYMPQIVAQFGNPAFRTEQGAHNYQIIGLEVTTAANTYSYDLFQLGLGTETSLDQLPFNLVLDRMYIHGDPAVGTKRGVSLNSKSTAIKNSYISGIKSTSQDAQAIMGWNGPGPYQILNNYLEATGENIMFGGATSAITGVIPSDIEVRHNYMYKPLSWRPGDPTYAGTNWWVKNLFELKNARRVVLDGNVLENCWANQQNGTAILLTPRTEQFAMPWVVVEDIVITNNIVRHAGGGLAITGADDDGSGKGHRIRIENNLLDDISSANWGGTGNLALVFNGADDVTFNHNTAFQNGNVIFSDIPVQNKNLIFTNNLMPIGGGISGSSMGAGLLAIAYYFPGSNITANVMVGGTASLYPAGNFFPASMSNVGFVNYAASDYHLTAQSAFHNAATDGKDVGADIDALNAATAGVTTSSAPPSGVPSVSLNPLSMGLSAGQTVQFTAPVSGTTNTNVIWTMTPEIGTISASGVYTAPASIYTPATVTITAYSAADVTQWATATISLSVSGPQTIAAIRVNAGAVGYTEFSGVVWSTDYGSDTIGYATKTANAINGAGSPTLYASQRAGSSLQYTYAVPNGTYTVKLKFAELTTTSAGSRLFNVVLNGAIVTSNLDVFAAAGGQYTPLDKTYTVSVTGGKIVIQLAGVVGDAILNGIEIIPAGAAAPPAFSPIRINAGGFALVDAAGTAWSADRGATNGAVALTLTPVKGTATPSLYQSQRYATGTLRYQFPVVNGSYTVTLKFAEFAYGGAGQRLFNIAMNGAAVESNFDIFAAAGGMATAVDKTYTVNVTNGTLTIDLIGVLVGPAVSAIDVEQAQAPVTQPPQTTFSPIRVNAGGAAYVDSNGNAWAADTNSSGSTYAVSAPISGTTTPVLYESERWSPSTLQYSFTVPAGTYTLNLKFAEIYFTSAGQRVFNIVINGQTVETNFDPLAAAGAPLKAIDKSYTVNTSTGAITVALVPVISNPKISAIEILAGGTPTVTPPPTTTPSPAIRIHAGGSAVTDSAGATWAADNSYMNGMTYATTVPVAGTSTPALYQTERWAEGTLQYQVPVSSGSYTVNLKFAEIYFTSAGQRVFNIVINGQTVESNFDPAAAAGAAFRAVDKSYTVNVTNGALTIQFVPVVSNPKVSAIEIIAGTTTPVTPPPSTPPPSATPAIRIDAGGPSVTDAAGNVWAADNSYSAAYTYSTPASIAGTTTPALYQTERWAAGTLEYRLAVANGSYTVNLKFAEIYFTSAGQRVFNIVINGQTVETNFDPAAAAGGAFKAIDKSYTINVTTGAVDIQLVPVVSNPKISAIEIIAGAAAPAPSPMTPVRINAGGSAITDSTGTTWAADNTYATSYTYSTIASIAGTTNPVLYQSERWAEGTLQYQVPAVNGTRTVNLKFAEIYFGTAGQRVFNIVINGQTVETNFDPFTAAGGANRAVDKQYQVNVTNGAITIQLVPVISNPKISGLEIY